MATHDYVIANQGFPSFRSDLNDVLQAIVSNNSNATEPSTTYAYQMWYETDTNNWYMRNADNDAWITLATFNQVTDTVNFIDSSSTVVGIATTATNTVLTLANGSVAINPAGFVSVGGAATQSGEIRFLEDTDNGANYVAVKSPTANVAGANFTLTLPEATDTLIGKATTDTLTNKTLTSPKINEDVAVTSTATELNLLDGVTSTTAELNILDGVTSTATELNILDGVTSTATEINKLDGLSRGSIIYGNASAATTVLTKGTANQVLTSDGTDISWQAAGANTPAFCAYRNYSDGGYQSIPNNTFTKCAFNAEYWDTASEFDSSTNYRWTAGTAGKYVIGTNIIIDNLADGASLLVSIYKNGSAVGTNAQGLNGIISSGNGNPEQCQLVSTIDVAASDYFEVYVKHQHGSSRDWRTEYGNVFYAHKLIT